MNYRDCLLMHGVETVHMVVRFICISYTPDVKSKSEKARILKNNYFPKSFAKMLFSAFF